MSEEQEFVSYLATHDKIPSSESISEWERHKPSFVSPMVRKLFSKTINFNFGNGKNRKMLIIEHEEIKEMFDITVPSYISVKIFNTKRPIASISFVFEDNYNNSGCRAEFLLNSPTKIVALYGFSRRKMSKSLWTLIWLVKLFNNTKIDLLRKSMQKSTKTDDLSDDELTDIKKAIRQLSKTVELLATRIGDEEE